MIRKLLVWLLWIAATPIFSQNQTVGLFTYLPGSFEGYTFFAPVMSDTAYLIDNCGRLIHKWPSNRKCAQGVYFLEDGSILRSEVLSNNSTFSGSGAAGGRVEKINAYGQVVWGYNYSSPTYIQHHDIEPLPNGNVLLLAYELKTPQDAKNAGRDTTKIPAGGLWLEHVIEVQPVGTDTGDIVWEWHLWDHLVQDFDITKSNYGNVSASYGKLDINFTHGLIQPDWAHFNSVKYNAELDQIMLTSRLTSEIYVIDHSTTTQEAAGNTGGNSGKGGQMLYRWGNPEVYRRGSDADKKLFGPHDAHWIPKSYPDGGKIIIFNNGVDRPAGNFSSVLILNPPVDSAGNYSITSGQAFGPSTPFWFYIGNPPSSFFSMAIGGAEQLPNGNILICEGLKGRFLEVDKNKNIVWKYVNPVAAGGNILAQGNTIPGLGQTLSNSVFKIRRFSPDYPGMSFFDNSPKGMIERNAYPDTCMILSREEIIKTAISPRLYPNPATDVLTFEYGRFNDFISLEVYNIQGQMLLLQSGKELHTINISSLPSGIYLLKATRRDGNVMTEKFVKR